MLQVLTKTVFAVAIFTLMFSVASESNAQFSRNPRVLNLPVFPQLQDIQRNYGQQNHQTYQQPTYPQPTCQRTTYPQPYYPQPTYVQPAVYVQPPQPQPTRALTPIELARKYTSQAKALFRNGRYADATQKLNEVVKRASKDTNAYQFRALTHFAERDFESAAADAYDALSLGNTWTREAIKSIYGAANLAVYDNQLQQLKQAAEANPSMQNHFLLAYHDLVNGRWSDGKMQLEKVLALQPDEPLSKKLLAAVNTKLAE